MGNWKNITIAGGGIVTSVVAAILTSFSGWQPSVQADVVKTALYVVGAVAIVYIGTDRLLDIAHPRPMEKK